MFQVSSLIYGIIQNYINFIPTGVYIILKILFPLLKYSFILTVFKEFFD